jgi:predicted DNA-binding transcriptional regulator YafY
LGSTARIFQIHQLIKRDRPVTLQGLMQRFEVSQATAKRDLALLRDQLGAPLIYDRDANHYRYDSTAAEFELPGLWFNESELFALLASEQLLESVQPGLLSPYLGPLRTRIRTLLEKGGHSGEAVTSRIVLQPIGRRQNRMECFGLVAGAVLDATVITIGYHGRGRDALSQRQVHPYRLLYYRDNWYLIAWCDKADALRSFALDRIVTARLTGNKVQAIDDESLQHHIGGGFGIFAGTVTDWAVLRFTPHAARWVADEQWHPEQIGHWRDDHYELHIPYANPTELLMDILKYGPDVEVLSPAALRHQVVERARQMLQQYQDEE